jgi:hypothetical protein
LYYFNNRSYLKIFILVFGIGFCNLSNSQSIEIINHSEQKELSKILFEKRLFKEPLYIFYTSLNGCFQCHNIFSSIFKDTSIYKNIIITVDGIEESQINNYRKQLSIPKQVQITANTILNDANIRFSKLKQNEVAAFKYLGGNTVTYINLKHTDNFVKLKNYKILHEKKTIEINLDSNNLINNIVDFAIIDSTYYYITSPTSSLYKYFKSNNLITIDSELYLQKYHYFISDINDSIRYINSASEVIKNYYGTIKNYGLKNYKFDHLKIHNDSLFIMGTISYPLFAPSGRIKFSGRKFFSPINLYSKEFRILRMDYENLNTIPIEDYGFNLDSGFRITPYYTNIASYKRKSIPMIINYSIEPHYLTPLIDESLTIDTNYFSIYKNQLKDLILKKSFISKNEFSFTYMPIIFLKNKLVFNYGYNDTFFLKLGYKNYLTIYDPSNNSRIISVVNYYGNISLLFLNFNGYELKTIDSYSLPIDYLKSPIFKLIDNKIVCAYYDKSLIIKSFEIP